MAQVVIFAPPGEDVSAGQTALEGAGHEVEVVEATAINLLHMAVGMMDDSEAPPEEEVSLDEPAAEEPPAEEEVPAEEPPVEEPPTTESVGTVVVDDETVRAYVNADIKFPLLRATSMSGTSKVSYKLNETLFSFWRDGSSSTASVHLENEGHQFMSNVEVRHGKTSHIILDTVTARRLGLQ